MRPGLPAMAICCLLLAGCASGPAGDARATFRAADLNGDWRLSPAEVEAHAHARFALLDRNGDGELDLAELGLADLPPEAQTLPFDLDGNGRLSRSEHLAYVRAVVDRAMRPGGTDLDWIAVDTLLVR